MEATTTPTTPTDWRARYAEASRCQEAINGLYGELGAGPADVAIRLRADRDHAQYPQYADHWSGDDWQLHQVTADIITKGGIRALAGDIVLARRDGTYPTFYSVRGGIDCSAPYGLRKLAR